VQEHNATRSKYRRLLIRLCPAPLKGPSAIVSTAREQGRWRHNTARPLA
jgi:hypothetical protein